MNDSSERRVKIVCTLGPSSNKEKTILPLIQAGLNVARLNFSHGTHDDHRELFRIVRSVSESCGKNTGIMQDLQGPKIRLGKLPGGPVELVDEEEVVLYPEGQSVKSFSKVKTQLPVSAEIAAAISKDVRPGARVLMDDGKVATRVLKVNPPEILVHVEVGGVVSSNKGLNLPGTPLSIPSLTEKDIEDLKLGLELGVDAVALSFVRSPKDIELVRSIIQKSNHRPLVISKMEREEAIERYEEIIDVSDGLLIARGDMAVELGAQRVPIVQKRLIHTCNELGVPVITATQMLESMIESPTPTRAEANDVANAVFDGTDAVMLSGETASGKYPLKVVETMSRIVVEAERFSDEYATGDPIVPLPGSIVDSIEFSAARIAAHVHARVVACISHSGRAVQTLAKYRPRTKIVAMVDRPEIQRRMAFLWGAEGILIPNILSTEDLLLSIEKELKDRDLASDGDHIVVTAGIPSLRRGTTNMVKVHEVGSRMERDTKVRV